MIVGYMRTSTVDQIAGIEAQERELCAAGCEKLFREQISSVDVKERHALSNALEFIREGDVLVVTKLDRLARSVGHMCELVKSIEAKGASLRILAMNIDTSTSTGKLMLNLLGSIAQFEREIMLERQKEGIQKAKAAGKYKGRAPTAQRKKSEIDALLGSGLGATEISKKLGISRASVYNVIKS
jgi:DNA invertase Pin-like site-specific DNA recombinase